MGGAERTEFVTVSNCERELFTRSWDISMPMPFPSEKSNACNKNIPDPDPKSVIDVMPLIIAP